ncbi:MAG: nuclear transport factor 2 family protein [Desulforegulaceae bacterium]|nr:nuclear transport factor 2 family protein [Desulforegulaceae bacterium]
MNNNKIYDDIHKALLRYLDTYFIERNLEKTLKLFNSQAFGFGTGADEKTSCSNDLEKFFSRDIKQAPNKIQYTIKKLDINLPSKDTGITACEINIKTIILKQEISFNNLRLSIFFKKNEKEWLIEHMHISLPTLEHGENESFPIKELEDKNKVLQRLVDEQTKTLKNANEKLEKAIKEIKTLRGILPICSHCKKIRSDDQSWHLMEAYISQHSEAEFSHSICPDCAKKHYPDYDLYKKKKQD